MSIQPAATVTVPMARAELRDQNGRPVAVEVPADYTQAECDDLADWIRTQLRLQLVARQAPGLIIRGAPGA